VGSTCKEVKYLTGAAVATATATNTIYTTTSTVTTTTTTTTSTTAAADSLLTGRPQDRIPVGRDFPFQSTAALGPTLSSVKFITVFFVGG
jgi:hypothetical protein